MPNAFDEFDLTVQQAYAAEIYSSDQDVSVASNAQFTINFKYKGGFNPAATAFEVDWYGTENDRRDGQNALSGAQAPSSVDFSPRTPRSGSDERIGSLTGQAPTLGQSEESRTIYAKLTIVQAALNV